jgi:prepilin-type N-terminal cleavage/methylation domain-containing protein
MKPVRQLACPPSRGFTLLEMLVAIIILGAVVAIMSATFAHTQRTLLFASEKLDAEQAGRALLQQMTTELSQAIATNGLALSCSGNSLTFCATLTPATTNALCELRKIQYQLAGTTVLNGLERSELLCGSAGWPGGAYETVVRVADNQIHQLSFECASASSSFAGSWSSAGLPAAVRIKLALVGTRTAARLVTMGGSDRFRDEYLVRLSTIVHLRSASLAP